LSLVWVGTENLHPEKSGVFHVRLSRCANLQNSCA
jgi:hypothetical protein